MSKHRCSYKKFKHGKCLTRIRSFDLFDEFELENCKILLIEIYPCKSREQLNVREGYSICNAECVNTIYWVEQDKNIVK